MKRLPVTLSRSKTKNGASQDLNVSGANTVQAAISNLNEGEVYSFTVRALNDTARSTPTATIMWAPAQRVTAQLRLYETSSSMGSGIMLPDQAGLTISDGGMWDICLDTRDDLFDIGSPTVSSYTSDEAQPKFPNGDVARVTMIGKTWTDVTSLDQVFESADLTQENLVETLIRFNQADAEGKPFAFVVKTQAGNYAKVLVKVNNGSLLQGTSPDRYVDLEVSYQSVIDVPYAGVDRTKWTQKKSAIGTVHIRDHK